MLVEIRRYEIEPGRRDEFVTFFDEEVLPEMRAAGMQILGQFVSIEDETVFYYLRGFRDEAERQAQTAAFYESPVWLDRLKDRALDMETGWKVEVVTPTTASAIG
jgi:hypothetical protein